PFETIVQKTDSFDHLLNNFLASYFSTALLMDENVLRADIQRIANETAWREDLLTSLLTRYDVTPEMLFQRLTNILPQHFGIRDIFFIRVYGSADLKTFRITKELHLSQLHNPYASALNEHYCRRWVSVNILKRLRAMGRPAASPLDGSGVVVADAQISQYWQTPNQYLCLSLAKPDTVHPKEGVSVTIGLLMNEKLRSQFRFTGDPGIPVRVVNNTCERCSLPDCSERVAAPVFVEREKEVAEVWEVLKGLA
ncbi:MAG: XRE family transcriptional regulator, partial [Bacteroidota bacterium]